MTMYEKIQYLCDEKGIKLATLSKETGIPKSTLSELKQGRTKTLSTQNLSKVCNFFEISLDFFEENSVDDFKDEIFQKRKALFDMSKRATNDQLDDLIDIFKNLLDEN